MTQVAYSSPAERYGPYVDFSDPIQPFGGLVLQHMAASDIAQNRRDLQTAIQMLVEHDTPDVEALVARVNARYIADGGITDFVEDNAENPIGVLQWLAQANAHHFADFCEYQTARYTSHHRALQDVKTELEYAASLGIAHLVNDEVLPQRASNKVARTLNRLAWFPINSFSAGANNINAVYQQRAQPIVAISNLFSDRWNLQGVNAVLKDSAKHEILHALGATNNAGFFTGMLADSHNSPNFLWLEEAFVTHMVQVSNPLHYPDINVIDPHARHDSYAAPYVEERRLLSLISTYGDNEITVAELGAAFMESRSSLVLRKNVLKKLQGNFAAALGVKNQQVLYAFCSKYGGYKNNQTEKMSVINKVIDRMMRNIFGSPQTVDKPKHLIPVPEGVLSAAEQAE